MARRREMPIGERHHVREHGARTRHHPKAPEVVEVRLARLRELAGRLVLTGPVPSWKFLKEDEPAERARD